MRSVMSKFWKEHLAQARDIEMMGEEPVGLFHGMLIEGDEKIRELEERLAARFELMGSMTARISELEALIADAPHSISCKEGMRAWDSPTDFEVCSCWKSRALDTGAKG